MDRFVIGTGRCGSTLLSRMLAENRALLMIFELFSGLDIATRFAPGEHAGEDFAALLERDTPALTMVMRRGYEIAEVVYPFDASSRYGREDRIPWVVAAALARISDRPDALLDETLAFARRRPAAPLASHYRALFDWLAAGTKRAVWIEKSGSSIEYLDALHACFPDARFLHLHRDGHEVALSMREHPVYRLWVAMMYGDAAIDPAHPPEPGPPGQDPVRDLLEARPPVSLFGRYWTDLIARGFRALAALDRAQYMAVRFEDLVTSPIETLDRIADFFELANAPTDWRARAARLVRGVPPTRFDRLDAHEQAILRESCRTGHQLLGRET